MDFENSNLSRIKPKLRTQGKITGNFGKPKMKAQSPLNSIGETNVEVVRCATQKEYLNRLYTAYNKTQDLKQRKFIFTQIRNIHIQNGTWQEFSKHFYS